MMSEMYYGVSRDGFCIIDEGMLYEYSMLDTLKKVGPVNFNSVRKYGRMVKVNAFSVLTSDDNSYIEIAQLCDNRFAVINKSNKELRKLSIDLYNNRNRCIRVMREEYKTSKGNYARTLYLYKG